MIKLSSHRLLLISQIALGLVSIFGLAASAAVGVYEFSASSAAGSPPVHITYRLNCPGSVTIEILDQNDRVVRTLGSFDEPAGLQSHDWDGTGASGGGNYRARITASSPATGTPGTLALQFGSRIYKSIYGLTIDRNPDSPGYGTIYVSDVAAGKLRAFHADGSIKTEFGSSGLLALGFTVNKGSPCGIGVDREGRIYVACSATSLTSMTGIKVFDYTGKEIEPYNVFKAQAQGNYWLDGLAGPQGPEIYETYGDHVRACVIGDADWHTAMPSIPSTTAKQICFETGGQACYVASNGMVSSNPGITRYVRQPDGQWAKDAGFDCGLSQYSVGGILASQRVIGVSCDSRLPGAPCNYGATSLWMGLDNTNLSYGGNIVRMTLPTGTRTFFYGPDIKTRFVAADSVGNVAVEYSVDSSGYWSWWGFYAPAGEASTDTRTTNSCALAGSASAQIFGLIGDLKSERDGSLVELSSSKVVIGAFDGCFYVGEADHSIGLKVECGTPVSEGTWVRVGGTLGTECGERVLQDAQIFAP